MRLLKMNVALCPYGQITLVTGTESLIEYFTNKYVFLNLKYL